MTDLQQVFTGNVLLKGDADYEAARLDAVWNGMKPDRFPAAIAIAESDEDCVAAVRVARERGWKIGIRSGGHSWTGNGVRDGGLLLDLSRLAGIEIDAKNATAAVRPGTRGQELQPTLNDAGFYFPAGTCPTVAIGGYILGGGAPFTGKLDGAACFSLEAIDVVTADGELVRADDENHPDLIWAARGAGPNFFGVVTRLHLKLQPLPRVMRGSQYIYPLDVVDEFLEWNIDLVDDVSPKLMHGWLAAESPIPDRPGTVLMQFGIAFGDDEEEADDLLKPLEESPFAERALAHIPPSPWSFAQGYALMDAIYVKGRHYRSDALWMHIHSDGFIDAMKQVIQTLPTKHSHVLASPLMSEGRHSHPNAAYSNETEFSLHVYGVSDDASEEKAMADYVNEAMEALLPHSNGGGKVNDCDLHQFPKALLSAENAARLERVRDQYDPDRVFHPALGYAAPEAATN